ncbi:hypothetical protein [Soonwooa sp.]|uniref:hypothetical protein n=1 Tax=Soonwooa sp. TaxID=1938592 RepID=UPI0028A7D878|nr:hypothetical protein [Soonwooa sp.]
MNFLKLFLPENSLKRKILNIKSDLKKIIAEYCTEKFSITYYGAYEINPNYLVFWICVKTDSMKNKLSQNEALREKLKNVLYTNDYPKNSIKSVIIDFESQETVDRESNGNWYFHFK